MPTACCAPGTGCATSNPNPNPNPGLNPNPNPNPNQADLRKLAKKAIAAQTDGGAEGQGQQAEVAAEGEGAPAGSSSLAETLAKQTVRAEP